MKRRISGIMLALLMASMLTLTFNIKPAKAEYLFYDDFDAGLVQWNNFGYPTPSTFTDPSFEDGWGYSTEGDSGYQSGSWSKQLIDISNGIVIEFRVKQGAGNVWDMFYVIGIGGIQSGYLEDYWPWYFGVEICGVNPDGSPDYTDDIRYRAFIETYIEDAANDHQFHIFKLVYDGSTNDVEFYKDGNFIVKLNAGPRPYDELPLLIVGRDYHDTNYLDWIRVSPLKPSLTVSITPSAAEIKVGESVTFTSTVSGGLLPYSYQWYVNGTAVEGATSQSWKFTPTTPGTYIIHLNVTDSTPQTAKSNTATVAVAPQLMALISPTSASILVGQSVTFTSTVSGGYPPYTYQWYLNNAPVSGATSATWTFTPTTAGIYYVHLKITDAKGNTAQSNAARITVAAVPVGGYSIPIQTPTTKQLTLYLILTVTLTIAYTKIKHKTKKQS